jgi:hypothetical protein
MEASPVNCFATLRRFAAPLALASLFALVSASRTSADDPAPATSEKVAKVVQKVAGEKKLLRYKFEKGQQVRWKVVHLSTVELNDTNFRQVTQSKTTSIKLWTVDSVDEDGSAVVVNVVEEIDLWRQANDSEPEKFNSRNDKNPPLAFEQFAQSIGKPLSTKTLSDRGAVLKAEGANQFDLGMGPVLPPLPEEPVGVGHRWTFPDEIRVRNHKSQQVKTVKVQYVYTLESFRGDLANIKVKTEILTPIKDPQEQAQLVQNTVNGALAIDLAKGQIVSRQIDWDANVVGFNGEQGTGSMNYLARLTETLVDGPQRLAPEASPAAEAKAPLIGPLPR